MLMSIKNPQHKKWHPSYGDTIYLGLSDSATLICLCIREIRFYQSSTVNNIMIHDIGSWGVVRPGTFLEFLAS